MQGVKGHGNPGGVRNGTETNEHENVNNWTHRVWPISSNYYGTSYPYATYCVGDASGNAWPASEPIAYVSNYNGQLPPDAAAYGMEGVYNPSVGAAYAAAATYAQPAPNNGAYNYYPAEYAASAGAVLATAAPPPWNAAAKAYENYYEDPAAAALKSIDQRLQGLDIDGGAGKLYAGEKKTTTWASIAKQPAKPMPPASSGGSKKKGPGMPPPPMVPGRNIDLNPWESKVAGGLPKAPVMLAQPAIAKTAVWNGPTLVAEPPPLMPACDLTAPPPHQIHAPHAAQLPPPQFDVSAPPPALPRKMYVAPAAPVASTPSPPPAPPAPAQQTSLAAAPANTATVAQPAPTTYGGAKSNEASAGSASAGSGSAYGNSAGATYGNSAGSATYGNSAGATYGNSAGSATIAAPSLSLSSSSCSSSSSSTCSSVARSPPAHSVVDKLRDKNNYNPRQLELPPEGTRFFVIKSYSEDDVHRSIKYEIWCSTERGNKRLDEAYAEQRACGGAVYLFFSVNGSGHFCGVAQMCSPVDYGASSSVWAQDKWKGQFGVRWVYVKDVPNSQLRHIRLENNENKPVTNSRDTQEVPFDKGLGVFKIIHAYTHTTSIFDDFTHYEKRQEEGDSNRRGGNGGGGGGGGGNGGGGAGGAPMQRGGPPPQRPNPFATRGSAMHKDREGGGGSSFSQMNQNRRGGRNNGSVGFTNHRNNHPSMLRS